MPFPKITTKKRLFIVSGVAVIIVIMLMLGFESSSADLPTYKVIRGEFIIDINASGELKALNSRAVTRPRIRWSRSQIVKLAPEGSIVKKG
ncbi:MAG: hypothetical protein ACE5HI_05165, partial [bacterium]